ncbi:MULTISPECIES: DUF1493 family protein [Caballeronia]|uniref:DUF1493 family protein n=1 Tax=Caballeronia jiangsuensis TaxID=1458357 RepID=A0ABW9CE52_9BURK|nr:DUF1493 family protein [Caballeronia sp. GaOx3]
MTQPSALSADLEALVLKHGHKSKHQPLMLSDRIDQDLEMAPEAAADLVTDFFERFAIDPGDFDFNRYFPWQGIRIPFLTKWLLKVWGVVDYGQSEPLTLGMFQRAIELGKWDTVELRSLCVAAS